jgi:hypothetical protein
VYIYVHRGEYSYVYKYLCLYRVSKKKIKELLILSGEAKCCHLNI